MPRNDVATPGSPVQGLNDGETIEWSQRAGIGIMILMRNGCFPRLLLVVVAAVLGSLAQGSPAGLLLIVAIFDIIAVIAFFVLLLYVIYLFVQMKRTTYYLTSERLIEVQGKSIKKEIPRSNLKRLAPEQYLKTVWAQKDSRRHYYNIFVTDSVTGVVVRMTAVDDVAADIIERWVKKQSK